jgi:hypothetical protein
MNEKELVGRVRRGQTFPHGHQLLTNENGENFYLIPKHSVYETFGYTFGSGKELGESINRSAIEKAVISSATIVFIYPRFLRCIKAIDLLRISNSLMAERVTSKGEVTVSIPLKDLEEIKRTF